MKFKLITATILGIAGIGLFAAPSLAERCRVDSRTGGMICEGDRNNRRNVDRRDVNRDRSMDSFEERNRRYNNRHGELEVRVDRLYREVLGRRPDRGGLRTYTDKMLDGWDDNRVRLELSRSQEAKNNIDRIHREELGRRADRDDLRTYQRHLANGWSLSEVRNDVRRSSRDRRGDRRIRYRR